MPRYDRIQRVAALMRAHPAAVEMDAYLLRHGCEPDAIGEDLVEELASECGTTACVAGWAVAVCLAEEGPLVIDDNDGQILYYTTARDWLGLDDVDASALFYGYSGPGSKSNYLAPFVLHHFVRTGRVTWLEDDLQTELSEG